MLIEYRRLIFPREDLVEAISTHYKAMGNKGFKGTVESLQITDKLELIVDLYDAAGKEKRSITLDEEYILAAMLRYCIGKQIPIAQKAEKNVELIDGDLALTMTIDEHVSSSTGEEYYILL